MRVKQYNGGGYGLNGLTPNGGVISAPLYLNPNPTNPLHAVTKEYTDRTLSKVPVGNIRGTIPSERFPAFTGEHIHSTSDGVFEIKPTGVTPGTYNKVTVNAKGLVVAGENVDESVLTNVPWTSITQDKPSTLEGYGITDALRSTGGTLAGQISVTDYPDSDAQLVTKKYVDDAVVAKEQEGGSKIGEIIKTTDPTTPSGYLRLNGAIVDKASYQQLYAVLGDRYMQADVPTDKFQLPDTSLTDPAGLYSYIRAF